MPALGCLLFLFHLPTLLLTVKGTIPFLIPFIPSITVAYSVLYYMAAVSSFIPVISHHSYLTSSHRSCPQCMKLSHILASYRLFLLLGKSPLTLFTGLAPISQMLRNVTSSQAFQVPKPLPQNATHCHKSCTSPQGSTHHTLFWNCLRNCVFPEAVVP